LKQILMFFKGVTKWRSRDLSL